MIHDADLIVAEVTNPSLGVGYELAYAENLGRPILCLFNTDSDKRLSSMIEGNKYNTIFNYSSQVDFNDAIEKFLLKH